MVGINDDVGAARVDAAGDGEPDVENKSGDQVQSPSGASAGHESASLAPDQRMHLVYDLEPKGTGKRTREKDGLPAVLSVKFFPADSYVAASYTDGTIRVFDTKDGKQYSALGKRRETREEMGMSDMDRAANIKAPAPATQLCWFPSQAVSNKTLLSVNTDGLIQWWHVQQGKCTASVQEEGNELYALDMYNDGQTFATAGTDKTIKIYDHSTRERVRTLTPYRDQKTGDEIGHVNRILTCKFHPTDWNIIVTSGFDNTVYVWDLRGDNLKARSFFGPVIKGDSVDISADGSKILSGSYRNKNALQTWDFGTGKLLDTIAWEGPGSGGSEKSSSVLAAQYCHGDVDDAMASRFIAAAGSYASELKIFDAQSHAVVGEVTNLESAVHALSWSHVGYVSKRLAIGCANGLVKIYDVQKATTT